MSTEPNNTTKRISVFGGRRFYPLGGMNDFICHASSVQEAHNSARESLNSLMSGYHDLWYEVWNGATFVVRMVSDDSEEWEEDTDWVDDEIKN